MSNTPTSATRFCLYRGRACPEPRDVKSSGDLHRFCRTHRERYNQYQRESQQRKRRREAALADAKSALEESEVEWLNAAESDELSDLDDLDDLDDDLLEVLLSLLER